MTTRERIEQDLTTAMKARDAAKLDVLRMLRAAIKNVEIDQRGAFEGAAMSDEDVVATVGKEVKKLRDALDQYAQGGRTDLVDKTRSEIAVMEAYLPQQLSDDELMHIVREEAEKSGVQSAKEFGKLMGAVMKRVQGRADGSRVKAAIDKTLSS